MTPKLIALLLESSLPLRLALLDAEPTGAGWYVNEWGASVYESAENYGANELRHHVTTGAGAWLPCNPLAIVEHAARLRFGPHGWFANLASDDGQAGDYRASIVRHSGENGRAGVALCPHAAAVALLREVVGC